MARVLITLLLAFYQLLKVCNILLNVLKVCITISFIQDGDKVGHIGRLKLAKGGSISVSFSSWLKYQNRVPNCNLEHLFFWQIVLRTVI